MRILGFHENAFFEYLEWYKENKQIFNKINVLMKEIIRTPYFSLGKPEPLKYGKEKYWSRRITEEHRLIYKVLDDMVLIISCKGHYK